MKIVPLDLRRKRQLIIGAMIAATAGVGLTLAHQSVNPLQSEKRNVHSETKITPSQSAEGVVENPPTVEIDGKSVEVKPNGSTTVPTPNGKATVRVDGNGTTVQRIESGSPNSPSASLNISVQSNNTDGKSEVRYRSESSSSTKSRIRVEQEGDAAVKVEP